MRFTRWPIDKALRFRWGASLIAAACLAGCDAAPPETEQTPIHVARKDHAHPTAFSGSPKPHMPVEPAFARMSDDTASALLVEMDDWETNEARSRAALPEVGALPTEQRLFALAHDLSDAADEARIFPLQDRDDAAQTLARLEIPETLHRLPSRLPAEDVETEYRPGDEHLPALEPEETAAAGDEETGADADGGAPVEQVSEVETLARELNEVRKEMRALKDSMSVYMEELVGELRAENARLRQELQRLHAHAEPQAPGTQGSPVPRPDSEALRALVQEQYGGGQDAEVLFEYDVAAMMDAAYESGAWEAFQESRGAAPAPEGLEITGAAPSDQQPPAGFGAEAASSEQQPPAGFGAEAEMDTVAGVPYQVVQEWGRSPEAAAQDGRQASSLLGMICAVPPNSSDDELVAFGRALRESFAEYDNINIEVFNDPVAANQFASTNVAPPDSRVMTVQKYGDAERDVILLIRGDDIREFPAAGEEAAG